MGFYKFDRDFMRRVAMDGELSGTECRVLFALGSVMRLPGDVVEASENELMRLTGICRRGVKKVRARLLKNGYLVYAGKGVGGVVLVRLADGEGDSARAQSCTRQGHEHAPAEGTIVPPVPQGTLYKETKETGETGDNRPEAEHVLFVNGQFVVPASLQDAWRKAYPDANIQRCLDEAAAWFLADGQRRSDYGVFLNNWIKRQKNSAPASNHKQQPKKESPYLPDGQMNPFYDYYATPEQIAEMEKWAMDDDDEISETPRKFEDARSLGT